MLAADRHSVRQPDFRYRRSKHRGRRLNKLRAGVLRVLSKPVDVPSLLRLVAGGVGLMLGHSLRN